MPTSPEVGTSSSEGSLDQAPQVAWLRAHAVDLVFGAVSTATYVLLIHHTRGLWYNGDDLKLVAVAQEGRFLEPFNSHMSLVILVAYRIGTDLGGLVSYLPLRLMSMGAFVSVAVAFYVHARRRVGQLLAAAGALVLMWFPNMIPVVSSLNHYTSAIGAVVAAAGLDHRSRRSDLVVAGGLTLALASAGGGVAVAVACVIHALMTRARPWRWAATLGPLALWATWYLSQSSRGRDQARTPVGLVEESLRFSAESFRFLAFGSTLVGVLLLVVFLLFAVQRGRMGMETAASMIAWSGALGFWWLALARSRPHLDQFRYWYLAAVFILLAAVPNRPLRGARVPPRLPLVQAAALAAGALLLVNHATPSLEQRAQVLRRHSNEHLATIAAIQSPDAAIPDDRSQVVRFMSAGQVRALIDDLGPPIRSDEPIDQTIVGFNVVRVTSARPVWQEVVSCRSMSEGMTVTSGSHPVVATHSSILEVRRFGEDWIPVQRLHQGQQDVHLPEVGSDQPWQVRSPDACVRSAPSPDGPDD